MTFKIYLCNKGFFALKWTLSNSIYHFLTIFDEIWKIVIIIEIALSDKMFYYIILPFSLLDVTCAITWSFYLSAVYSSGSLLGVIYPLYVGKQPFLEG